MNDENNFIASQCSFICQGSISDAIIKCLDNPYYSVGVYTSTCEEKERVRKTFISEWQHILGIRLTTMEYQYTAYYYGFRWQFSNGSTIRVMINKENVRGFGFNLALISDSLSSAYIRNVVYPCLRVYNTGLQQVQFIDADSGYHIVNEYNKRKQNTDFINEDALDCEDNHELDEFINSFKINKNT